MKPTRHVNAKSIEEAVALLKEGHSAMLAGGTDLLGALKDEIYPEPPTRLVNIKTVEGLEYIREEDGALHIGALTRLHAVARHPQVRARYTVLAEAAESVAMPQIRHMATVGGNLCQEPRCWYYRHPDNRFHCLRKGGGECAAQAGENRYHSVFGGLRVHAPACVQECPAGSYIPQYLASLRAGDFHNAARRLLETNPIPAVTGRVCPHFCQQGCNRCELDEAVGIRDVERHVGDYVLEHWDDLVQAPELTGRRVAVVGSGPAGLAAAFYLRRLGNAVEVFDRFPRAGGMLTYAIPGYRLPPVVVEQVVARFQALGIRFRLGVDVGTDLTLEELRAGFDAVFLASGTWKQPSIGLEGEALTEYGLDFLRRIAAGEPTPVGRQVVVIGGGAVAVDVAISALRLGAGSVTMVSLEQRDELPAYEWEVDQALEEQVALMPGWGPQRVAVRDGKVTGIDLVACTAVFDAQGRFAPQLDTNVRAHLECDQVFLAVGQRADLAYAASLATERGLAVADAETQRTSLAGVYAGGDMQRPASVIEAVAAGRRAAYAIDADLRGEPMQAPVFEAEDEFLVFDGECLQAHASTRPAVLPVAERRIDVEDAFGLSAEQAVREAFRCMNCACVAVSPSDLAPALIALDAVVHTDRRSVAAGAFFTAGLARSTVLEADEMVREIEVPAPKPGSRSTYMKFRLRRSIDFPILGLAIRLDGPATRLDAARLVLGAAAPVPLRLRAVEEFLAGKALSDQAAAEAADLAVRDTAPLEANGYKVQVIRALVKRGLLAKGV